MEYSGSDDGGSGVKKSAVKPSNNQSNIKYNNQYITITL